MQTQINPVKLTNRGLQRLMTTDQVTSKGEEVFMSERCEYFRKSGDRFLKIGKRTVLRKKA